MSGQFRIINNLHLIRPRDERDPLRPPLYGELAFCPSLGCRVARAATSGCRGGQVLQYWRVSDDAAVPPEPLGGVGDEIAGLQLTREDMSASPRKGLRRLEPTAAELEVADFSRHWPILAEKLGIRRAIPTRLFDAGEILVPSAFDQRAGDVQWRSLVDLHSGGDWGESGSIAEAAMADDEAAWLSGLGDRSTLNAHAMRYGGLVVSTYRLPHNPKATAHVHTSIGADRYTLCWTQVAA